MGSSGQPDRSLGSGISLPQWMKSKMDARFDFDDSTFSPPSHDDSFFYLKYPKSKDNTDNNKSCKEKEGFRPISEVLLNDRDRETKTTTITAATAAAATAASNQITSSSSQQSSNYQNFKETGNIDFSKHPAPCQPFVPNSAQKVGEPKPSKSSFSGKVKSQGIDDGFHGQSALCGKSIVHVANQMMSGKITKGFTLESSQNETSEETSTSGIQNTTTENHSNVLKKGSKSLPASPLPSPMSTPDNSPKSRRRVIQSNRFFTGSFQIPDKEKYQGGWILSSILGQQREIVPTKIEEEDETGEEIIAVSGSKILGRKKSISTQNLTYLNKEEEKREVVKENNQQPEQLMSNKNIYTNVFQAKPSELREMNFWSPTSM